MMLLSGVLVLTFSCFLAPLLLCYLPEVSAQKSGSRWLIGDRDSHCGISCSRTLGKSVCGSDGRSYETGCELQKARCRDKTLTLAHRGRCRAKSFQHPVAPAPTSSLEGRDVESKDASQSKCRLERNAALELSRRPQEAIFIPECNEDGTYAQVQCHTLTGYCWCVTNDGKPVSGSSVHNRTPVCSGNLSEYMGTHAGKSGLSESVTDKPPGTPTTGKRVSFRFFLTLNPDEGSKPTPTMETHISPEGEEITAPTLWKKQLVSQENKQNSSTVRRQGSFTLWSNACCWFQELSERQIALDEAGRSPHRDFFIPDCGTGGLYKAVQCHQSTGYCWCVLVDTGRPIPGTSTRYKTPECDEAARSQISGAYDPFQDRPLTGCPEGKKVEFVTSLLDALTTDMVQAINSPAPSGGGRFVEPDPSHTLEERVVHWYFAQLDNNSSHDINKKELKPFKRYLKKKAKPKKCARKFTDYCDLNKDRAISLQELKGCLGVSKEGSSVSSGNLGALPGSHLFIGRLA
ncbi:SPARC-related modular calcium-binding protein 1 isoform X4 [Nothobranchius furzeri]|uniref:SPARC-related modular calcium-binding protein 1 isoform X4 n=1 Tax=Nothobranchius furzeri TaxID=105023 RepID=UPI002403B7CF|nr:SPARC-related modular calcium-binding protein 1 isoform X4 [Nothobranchius furzeri]